MAVQGGAGEATDRGLGVRIADPAHRERGLGHDVAAAGRRGEGGRLFGGGDRLVVAARPVPGPRGPEVEPGHVGAGEAGERGGLGRAGLVARGVGVGPQRGRLVGGPGPPGGRLRGDLGPAASQCAATRTAGTPGRVVPSSAIRRWAARARSGVSRTVRASRTSSCANIRLRPSAARTSSPARSAAAVASPATATSTSAAAAASSASRWEATRLADSRTRTWSSRRETVSRRTSVGTSACGPPDPATVGVPRPAPTATGSSSGNPPLRARTAAGSPSWRPRTR